MQLSCFHDVRCALRGGTVLFVGGNPNHRAVRRIRDAFVLNDVIHCSTRKSDASPRRFEGMLLRPDLLLAVALVGVTRTEHGRHVHRASRAIGLPFVDCFHFPHPNLLAARISQLGLIDQIAHRRIA